MEEKILEGEISKSLDQATRVYSSLGSISRSSIRAFAFIIAGLKIIYKKENFTDGELKKIITDGDGDQNIDAVIIGDRYVDLFDFSFEHPKADQMVLLESSIKKFIKHKSDELLSVNPRLRVALKKIRSRNNRNKILRLFVVRKSNWVKCGSEEILQRCMRGMSGEFQYINTKQFFSLMLVPTNYLKCWECDLKQKNDIFFCPDGNGEQDEVVLKIPIKNLLMLLRTCQEKGYNLFNKNVRVFLDNKKLSNSMKSVLENNPGKFHIFHNGIAFTAKKIVPKGSLGFDIHEPQIVNGAQTINSLYSHYKYNLNNVMLSKAKVVCKIIKADETLTNKICETSNTQIPIKPWDLRANDDVQIKVEKFIDTIPGGFKYKRKAKEKNEAGKKIIKLDELAQWIYSSIDKKPAAAKDKKGDLFDIVSPDSIYQKISTNLMSTDTVSILCKIGHFIRVKISKSKKAERGFLRDVDMHLIAALYFLIRNRRKSENKMEHYADKEIRILKKYTKKLRKNDPDITNNKIFTKSEEAWKYLFNKITVL